MANRTWELSKEFKFEAAHQLPNHDGKCQRLHGHSWRGVVTCKFNELVQSGPKDGMGIDYADIKKVMKPIVDNFLDHHYLNDTLEMESPTSERVAQWIYQMIKDTLPVVSVTIYETCTSKCTYSETE